MFSSNLYLPLYILSFFIFGDVSSFIKSLTGPVGDRFELAKLKGLRAYFVFGQGQFCTENRFFLSHPYYISVQCSIHIPVRAKRSEDAMWHLLFCNTYICYHCGTNHGFFMVIAFMIFSKFSPTVFIFIVSSVLLF